MTDVAGSLSRDKKRLRRREALIYRAAVMINGGRKLRKEEHADKSGEG